MALEKTKAALEKYEKEKKDDYRGTEKRLEREVGEGVLHEAVEPHRAHRHGFFESVGHNVGMSVENWKAERKRKVFAEREERMKFKKLRDEEYHKALEEERAEAAKRSGTAAAKRRYAPNKTGFGGFQTQSLGEAGFSILNNLGRQGRIASGEGNRNGLFNMDAMLPRQPAARKTNGGHTHSPGIRYHPNDLGVGLRYDPNELGHFGFKANKKSKDKKGKKKHEQTLRHGIKGFRPEFSFG